MEKRFEAKAALITGGASGIGRAAGLRLAAEGACVAIADIDAVAFLACDEASFITGAILAVDGGSLAKGR